MNYLEQIYHSNYNLSTGTQYIAPLILTILNKILNDEKRIFSLLDVGCGNGAMLQYFSNSVLKNKLSLSGIDFYKNDIDGIHFIQQDLNQNFSVDLGQYDIVISCEVIEHIIDTDHFIGQIKKLLKPNGSLILSTPNLSSYLNRLILLFGFQPLHTEVSWLNPYLGREELYRFLKSQKFPAAGHLRLFTHKALKEFLKYYDFKIIQETGFIPYEGIVKYISQLFVHSPSLAPSMLFWAKLA